MNRRLWFGGLLLLCLWSFSVPVSAHVLQSDGNIGAVLHIDPDDDPVAAQPQNFILYFKDTTDHFSLAKCACRLQIVGINNQSIYNYPLLATSDQISQNPYTFAASNVYSVVVTGMPKQPNAFQAFKLTYLIRVEKGAGAAENGADGHITLSLAVGLLLLQALLLLGIYQWVHTNRRNHA